MSKLASIPAGTLTAPDMTVAEQVAFLRTILESSTEYSIVAKDLSGNILAWNEGAHRIYGYESGDAIGKSAFILHHLEDIASGRARAILDEVRRIGKWSGELRRVRKNGVVFNALVTITLRHAADGSPIGFTMISQDLTESHRPLKELKESHQYNRWLIESNIGALMTTDPLGIISDVNRQMCEMTGYSRQELIGSPFKDYFTDPRRAEEGIRQVLAEDRVTNYELVTRSRSGPETVVSYNATTFRSANGKLKGVFAAARDITAQKRLEEDLRQAQNYTRGLIEASVDALLTVDAELLVTDVNEQTLRLTGYSREELIGSPFPGYFTEPARAVDGVKKTLGEGFVTDYVLVLRSRNGRETLVSFNASVFKDAAGQVRGVFASARDITEQKRLEEQLRRQNEELEEQNRRVQQANRLKSEFLANMSHELRTPLNAIIGFSELLHDGRAGAVSAKQRDYVGDVLSSARHLLQLINDVLDLSKVESGKMEYFPEPIEPQRLVSEVCDVLRTLTARKRITLLTEIDPQLTGLVLDPAKLKQVLFNYLSNALKFTPEEGRVTIRMRPVDREDVLLEVEDTGIGIRANDLPRLFVEFQQLDASASKKYQGTGLGLALTKRIVEAQGGEIGVVSTKGKGSTFSARLPRVAHINGTTAAAPTESRPDAGRRGLLVIEDNRRDREWLITTLAGAGYLVESAATGGEALRLLSERCFDAIILDLILPDMSGWDVLRRTRAGGPNRAVPAVVVSVLADQGTGVGYAISDFLEKPVTGHDLFDAVRRVIAAGGGDGKTVLLVDDDRKDLKLFQAVLEQHGYATIARSSATAGLRAAAEKPPDVVVLDLVMPRVDGFEFLRRLRATRSGRGIPVVVLTAKHLVKAERDLLAATAQGVVTKGDGSVGVLLAALHGALTAARAGHDKFRSARSGKGG